MSHYSVDGVDIVTLPKVSLHDHLDGSLRPETLLELAAQAQVETPEDNPDDLADWFERQSNSGSLVEYLTTFDLTCAVAQTAPALERIARESVLDLVADGVIYGELRWAPEQHLSRGLTLDSAVEAVQEGIQQGIAEAARAGKSVRIGQLVTAMRHADRSLEIAKLALRHRDAGVVGFDIAGAEAGFLPAAHRAAFDELASEYFPTTVHAGEADGLASIRSAILDGRALRLGHGVRIAEDITIESAEDDVSYVKLGRLAEWVKDRAITLELCPTSNLQTGAVAQWGLTLDAHPFDLLYQLDFCVTVNSDNRLQSGTSLSRELSLLVDTFGYTLSDIEQFQQNACASAFLPAEDRDEMAEVIANGFEDAVRASR